MRTSLNALHHQSNDWLRDLEFYKDDVAVQVKRLEEVASSNTSKDLLAKVEHFQNKFIMLREQIDTLTHDVNARNHEVTEISKTRPEHVTEKFNATASGLHKRMKDFTHVLADTRFEFNNFLGEVM